MYRIESCAEWIVKRLSISCILVYIIGYIIWHFRILINKLSTFMTFYKVCFKCGYILLYKLQIVYHCILIEHPSHYRLYFHAFPSLIIIQMHLCFLACFPWGMNVDHHACVMLRRPLWWILCAVPPSPVMLYDAHKHWSSQCCFNGRCSREPWTVITHTQWPCVSPSTHTHTCKI